MAKSTGRWSIARLLGRAVLAAVVGITLLGFYWLITFPDVAALKTANPYSTALMDARSAQAKAAGEPAVRRWTWVPLSRVSPHLQRAVIAAEDAQFFSHEGFDWEGVREAAIKNLEAGKVVHGGSTITQQLAKNLYLSSERSLLRKAQEALITRSLEHHLSKRRILELYLNVAEWGRGVYGAEAAAQHHFHKSALELTEEEAATLAAILPSPRRYDPLRITRHVAARQRTILRNMDKVRTRVSNASP
ncbi:MAG TPA: monofunctional biosynthetic peptidoglycan transglycosylase [Nitrospiraceae bacterium]|nr:monofunctional biosynthetic peptidoglycan transglycosylase [Nitrospiraceae bacterium]